MLKRIEQLEADLRERDKAVRILTAQEAMEIKLPWATYATIDGDAPRLSGGKDLGERMLKILEPALNKHGAKLPHVPTAKSLDLQERGYHGPRSGFVVPIVWGEVMAEIIDCAAQFGRECYAAGFERGSDLLGKLTAGAISADQFEESLDREKAIRRQENKDIHNKIATH